MECSYTFMWLLMVTLVLEYYRVMQDQLENCFSDWSLLLKYCIYHELVLNNNNSRFKKKKCLVLKVQCHFSPVKPASTTVATSSQTTPTGDSFSFLYSEN